MLDPSSWIWSLSLSPLVLSLPLSLYLVSHRFAGQMHLRWTTGIVLKEKDTFISLSLSLSFLIYYYYTHTHTHTHTQNPSPPSFSQWTNVDVKIFEQILHLVGCLLPHIFTHAENCLHFQNGKVCWGLSKLSLARFSAWNVCQGFSDTSERLKTFCTGKWKVCWATQCCGHFLEFWTQS